MKVLHVALYWKRWSTRDWMPWWQFWRSSEPFYPRQFSIHWLHWELAGKFGFVNNAELLPQGQGGKDG